MMKRMAVETQEGKKVALENGVVVISKFTLINTYLQWEKNNSMKIESLEISGRWKYIHMSIGGNIYTCFPKEQGR